MFVDNKKFRRQFKIAYDGTGVQVMNDGERLYIAAPDWALEVELDDVPNAMKAAIIEMCGEIPDRGLAFTARAGECNQETIVYSVWTPSREYTECSARKVDKTPISYRLHHCPEWRILQTCDTGECILADAELLSMISEKAIDEDKESFPQYPELCGDVLIWQNCMGALAIRAQAAVYMTKEEEVMNALQKVRLSSEQWTRAVGKYKGAYNESDDSED